MAARREKDKPPFLVFECVVEGCDAEFYLNDIPTVRRGPELGTFSAAQSNQYVIAGENEIGIVVNPGPTPAEAMAGRGGRRERLAVKDAKAMARLVRYPFGAVVGGPDGEVLLHCDWQATEEETQVVFPLAVAASRDLGLATGAWSWQEAERLELDDETRAEIGDFLEEIHRSLDAGNPDPLIEYGRPRVADLSRAYGTSAADKESQIRSVTESDSQQSWWGMQPLDPERYSLRLCANDRLVELIAADWDPILKELPDDSDGVGQYGMFVGKLDGEWAILL